MYGINVALHSFDINQAHAVVGIEIFVRSYTLGHFRPLPWSAVSSQRQHAFSFTGKVGSEVSLLTERLVKIHTLNGAIRIPCGDRSRGPA